MRSFSTTCLRATVLAFAGLLVCAASPVHAQILPPHWDHYWVYDVVAAQPVTAPPVMLTDQFETWNHQVLAMRHFANPVKKEHGDVVFPISRPELHYTWWEIDPHPFHKPGIVVTNQFGPQMLDVFAPRFLLNPARKNEPGPPPLANHYKCYDCVAPPVQELVRLTDQFGQREAIVREPQLLCNPVVKTLPDGRMYPIEDPAQHLVCYRLDPLPFHYSAIVTDQFVEGFQIEIGADHWLCVPSDKHDPTPTAPSTWGRIKTLYR